MGSEAHARLYYGFQLDEDVSADVAGQVEYGDLVSYLATKLGFTEECPPYNGKGYYGPEWEAWQVLHTEWKARQDAVLDAAGLLNVDLLGWGYDPGEGGGYCLAIDAPQFSEGDAVTPADLVVNPSWDETLRKAAEMIGVPFETPAWHLAASYG